MLTSELDYDLPAELIAQIPVEPRDNSRLMVIDRMSAVISHRLFRDLPQLLHPNDLLVANDSRVIAARLYGRKPSGGKVELLLLRKLDSTHWRGLVGGRNVHEVLLMLPGQQTITAQVQYDADADDWMIAFPCPIEPFMDKLGTMPLPPYIHEHLADPERYQTVYAKVTGSAAAPTAGLHFTPTLIQRLQAAGVAFGFVTLHVGVDTFKPISEDTVETHRIHSEWCELPEETATAIEDARSRRGRVVAVGTTSARVLESAALHNADRTCKTYRGDTQLYITPGYAFGAVDAMITNFHLPRSTLLAMVGAFAGTELMWTAYREAIREHYRFYSFGDAMLIL